jgi:hypothetical protein
MARQAGVSALLKAFQRGGQFQASMGCQGSWRPRSGRDGALVSSVMQWIPYSGIEQLKEAGLGTVAGWTVSEFHTCLLLSARSSR